jgi:hypothetical protein
VAGDEADGVLAAGCEVAVLWVAVVLWAAGLVFFLAGWWWTTSLEGEGTVATEATVALAC